VSGISDRKLSHLELCTSSDVEGRGTTLLEEVHLFHDPLPELSLDEVDPSVELFGRRLAAPLVISGMTGGATVAGEVNRVLAGAAQKLGIAMGVGSQRAMLQDAQLADTYRVRDVAPDVLLFANVGAVQARETGVDAIARLVETIAADALCIHLNPAQELVQDEGDRDFRGCLDAIVTLSRGLSVPVIVKETGCGFAPGTLERLREAGVDWVDVAGAGGTSWTAVEAQRGSQRQRALGAELWSWGIPTAPSVVFARAAGLNVIASGGIRSATDVLRALALGADAAGLALPFLRAWDEGGSEAVLEAGTQLVEGLRSLMLLVAARRVGDLRYTPRVLGPSLRSWIER